MNQNQVFNTVAKIKQAKSFDGIFGNPLDVDMRDHALLILRLMAKVFSDNTDTMKKQYAADIDTAFNLQKESEKKVEAEAEARQETAKDPDGTTAKTSEAKQIEQKAEQREEVANDNYLNLEGLKKGQKTPEELFALTSVLARKVFSAKSLAEIDDIFSKPSEEFVKAYGTKENAKEVLANARKVFTDKIYEYTTKEQYAAFSQENLKANSVDIKAIQKKDSIGQMSDFYDMFAGLNTDMDRELLYHVIKGSIQDDKELSGKFQMLRNLKHSYMISKTQVDEDVRKNAWAAEGFLLVKDEKEKADAEESLKNGTLREDYPEAAAIFGVPVIVTEDQVKRDSEYAKKARMNKNAKIYSDEKELQRQLGIINGASKTEKEKQEKMNNLQSKSVRDNGYKTLGLLLSEKEKANTAPVFVKIGRSIKNVAKYVVVKTKRAAIFVGQKFKAFGKWVATKFKELKEYIKDNSKKALKQKLEQVTGELNKTKAALDTLRKDEPAKAMQADVAEVEVAKQDPAVVQTAPQTQQKAAVGAAPQREIASIKLNGSAKSSRLSKSAQASKTASPTQGSKDEAISAARK